MKSLQAWGRGWGRLPSALPTTPGQVQAPLSHHLALTFPSYRCCSWHDSKEGTHLNTHLAPALGPQPWASAGTGTQDILAELSEEPSGDRTPHGAEPGGWTVVSKVVAAPSIPRRAGLPTRQAPPPSFLLKDTQVGRARQLVASA